jgi:hypothetical protein
MALTPITYLSGINDPIKKFVPPHSPVSSSSSSSITTKIKKCSTKRCERNKYWRFLSLSTLEVKVNILEE